MEYLRLNSIGEILTKSAEEKLEVENDYQIPKCSNGKTSEFYDDIGIPLPPDLVEKIKLQEEGVKLEDEDFEKVISDVLVPTNQIKLIVDSEEFTTIFLNDGLSVNVLETVEEIEYLQLNFMQKIFKKFA